MFAVHGISQEHDKLGKCRRVCKKDRRGPGTNGSPLCELHRFDHGIVQRICARWQTNFFCILQIGWSRRKGQHWVRALELLHDSLVLLEPVGEAFGFCKQDELAQKLRIGLADRPWAKLLKSADNKGNLTLYTLLRISQPSLMASRIWPRRARQRAAPSFAA